MRANVILACGGKGSRAGLGFNKILAKLDGESIICRTVNKFINIPDISRIIISAAENDISSIKSSLSHLIGAEEIVYCIGGATRTDSIISGLKMTESDADVICIHDGARPYVTPDIIRDSLNSAYVYGSGISAVSSADTIAIAKDGKISQVPQRDTVYSIQTPQSFRADLIKKAYSMISEGDIFTDDSSVYAKYIDNPTLSKGDVCNKKITYPTDLLTYSNCYIGVGYDTHKLVEGRKLILGGIDIPHPTGLLGHSDADVLTHAIMDAIFNACGERDIGVHFPDTDERYKGIASTLLLTECMNIIRSKGYEVSYISCVIMCEKPKLKKIIPDMIDSLTAVMRIPRGSLNLSATTTEGLGFVGREEGISVHANCICYKK